ncbi:beta-glucosidase [Butyrivibrio sp. ob235]|uniref:glycoside hydrolase family 3 N-terminal domain-containing protein n=1 Tax=Butyrivibrio sp. ob235 TaxID=1761780 RepID=UPI0008C97FB8|nr:glycoside hydrolase family 3 N-terminal domain-containing protein [Butyrivibrio sp. ob235]SEK27159.1 beta-glucosidase [Butyrivibrio sp. ob235]
MKNEDLKKLLDDMSLKEKVLQLVQLPGQAFEENAAVTGLSDEGASEEEKSLVGSTLGIWGAEKIIEIQKKYMDKHPHHIPLLFMLDVIHGHKTVFPCPLGQGATFDPEIAKTGAEVQAREAAAEGVHVTFSPMGDLVRDARWGRVLESTGEDPYLNGKMVSAMVEGYQGKDLKDINHIAACVKHFAAYGAATSGRDYNSVELSESMLRDQYLPAYAEGIKKGARLVMTSFNTLNGIPSSGNTWLMRDILRNEMEFDGVLISDWAAVAEMATWGFAKDLKEAAELAMKAGVDIDMCTESYGRNLEELLDEGKISKDLLDEAVMRVLTLKNDLGLFEDPFRGASATREQEECLSDKNREIARDAVRKSLVLLKNDYNALPLVEKKIAFIGPYSDEKNLHSSWAISCDSKDAVSVKKAAKELYDDTDTRIKVAKGCLIASNGDEFMNGTFSDEKEKEKNKKLFKKAMEVAEWADEIVFCLGEHIGQSGESTSKTDLRIPRAQKKLFEKICKKFRNDKHIITLIFCGRPLELENIPEKSDALMICFRPGTEGGHGIMDVLGGNYSPSGKLSMSFPYSAAQAPLNYNAFSTGRPKPSEGLSIFTTRYLDCPNEARYPFGFGLTYSQFKISDVILNKNTLNKADEDDFIRATVTVRNTGFHEATETVQLYIRDMVGSRVRPIKELKGFRKVSLLPGESKEISFDISEDMLRFWTIENKNDSEPGDFKVFVGFDSTTDNSEDFELI